MREPMISIVIPAYNEAERLPASLDRIAAYLRAQEMEAEIIVVDDGSTDGTADVVRARMAGLPRLRLASAGRNQGKGAAVRLGMLEATGDYRLFTAADLGVPIDDLENLLLPLRKGYGVAIASRGLRASDVQLRQPWPREVLGKLFNKLVR